MRSATILTMVFVAVLAISSAGIAQTTWEKYEGNPIADMGAL